MALTIVVDDTDSDGGAAAESALSVKNTFIELVVKGSKSRSPSTPASWRPGNASLQPAEGEQADGWLSDGSATTASRTHSQAGLQRKDLPGTPQEEARTRAPTASTQAADLWPDTDDDEELFASSSMDRCRPCQAAPGCAEAVAAPALAAWQPPSPPAASAPPPPPPPPLSLEAPTSGATPLNRQAPAFTPAAALPSADTPQQNELTGILDAMKAAFLKIPDAADAQVLRHGTGITVHATFKCQQRPERVKRAQDAMKQTLLGASQGSENTYMLGYGANPFKDDAWDGGSSFVAALSYLPPSRASSACWDTYQHGFCPRRAKCWWSHPCDVDTHRVRVSFGAAPDAAAPGEEGAPSGTGAVGEALTFQ